MLLLPVAILSTAAALVHPQLLNLLQADGQADALIQFPPLPQASLSLLGQQSGLSRSARARLLVSRLQEHANEHQRQARRVLDEAGQAYEVLWINNSLRVRGLRSELVVHLAADPSSPLSLLPDRIIARPFPVYGQALSNNGQESQSSSPEESSGHEGEEEVQWNVAMVKADRVWGLSRGEGILVGHIDTGVNVNHPLLKDNWSGLWRDAQPDPWREATPQPTDEDGHGTHTLGTAVGSGGIGVAPGAQWLACRGCGQMGCPQGALLACAQWLLCPDAGVCERVPHVVSNSWGGPPFPLGGETDPFVELLEAWQAVGIVPVFAQGNEGPDCGTGGTPALHPQAIAVGSIGQAGLLSPFSSRGPAPAGHSKPDLVAPGEAILSASASLSDSMLQKLSGTSMACPHVAGLIALLLAHHPHLTTIKEIRQVLQSSTTRSLAKRPLPGPLLCGQLAWDASPLNNHYGHGLINAELAMTLAAEGLAQRKESPKELRTESPKELRTESRQRMKWLVGLRSLFPWWIARHL